MTEKIELVVAYDKNRGIGINGDLPWHIPADLKHFRDITSTTTDPNKQNAVVMGRKTWESIPEKYKPLPNRLNIVLSRQTTLILPENVLLASSIDHAKQLICNKNIETLFIIGGGQIFHDAIQSHLCQKLHLTIIENTYDCDTFFPDFSETYISMNDGVTHTENNLSYTFETFISRFQ